MDITGISTEHLIGSAMRATPRHECDRWIVTNDNRSWHRQTDGSGWFAYDGTRDDHGVSIQVASWTDEDLREFAIEQLEHYGVTVAQINHMFS
jgi:hypothetical protein